MNTFSTKHGKIFTSLAILSALSVSHAAFAQGGCVVWDRYFGKKEIPRNTRIPNLAGMNFPSYSECSPVWDVDAEDYVGTKCETRGGGKMDDKINGVVVPPGCVFGVAEHPNFKGASVLFVPGRFDNIQWTHVNDISSVNCACGGDPTHEFSVPPIIVR